MTAVGERTTVLGRDPDGEPLPPLRHRLANPSPARDTWLGWLGPLLVTVLAGLVRMVGLGRPHVFVFDETYYPKDAYALLRRGYAVGFTENADEQILAGRFDVLTNEPSKVVHPEGGKWLIAAGEWLWGGGPFGGPVTLSPVGWRLTTAVLGTLTVLVLARLVRRLTGSTLLGCVAGLLLAVDGLAVTTSRTAILDGILAFWLVAGVACLVADRDHARRRLADILPGGRTEGFGPVRALLWRPWRLAAGGCFGVAVATKWSALPVLAAFGLLSWAWDVGARRALGVQRPVLRSALADGVPAFGSVVLVAAVVYIGSWAGWLAHAAEFEQAFGHEWGGAPATDAHGFIAETAQSLGSLAGYHEVIVRFHTEGLNEETHPYQSDPGGWLLLNRPVGFDAQLDIPPGAQGCPAAKGDTCLRQVLALGTPLLWWGGIAALVAGLVFWLGQRDWRYGVPLVGVAATWLPWFRYDDRPIFSFYAAATIPFTVIAVTLVLGRILGGADASARRRTWGAGIAGCYVALVVANFAYFYPLFVDQLITRDDWADRMWFATWI